jgi:hypothetical protein
MAFRSSWPRKLKSTLLRISWATFYVPSKIFLCLLCAFVLRKRALKMRRSLLRTRIELETFAKLDAISRKTRRRKLKSNHENNNFATKDGRRDDASAPAWMRVERTEMKTRFELALKEQEERLEGLDSDCEKHLYVLMHGLAGSEDDLLALATELIMDKNNVVFIPKSCTPMRSFDGIVAGGERIVDELEEFIENYDDDDDGKKRTNLKWISFVGNSMGGLYCRYVLTRLFERDSKTICGLEMHTFLTTATPHLGVGEFGYFDLVPGYLRQWAGCGLGQSVKDLCMFDVEDEDFDVNDKQKLPLLARMTMDDEENNMFFIEALASFKRRCTYANSCNDFLVAYETASIRHDKLSRKQEAEWATLSGGPQVVFDDVLTLEDRGLAKLQPNQDRTELIKKNKKIVGNERYTKFMEYNLRSAGFFRHVDVVFPGPMPIAHNKIVALQRNELTAKWFKEGEIIVRHTANYLKSDIDL